MSNVLHTFSSTFTIYRLTQMAVFIDGQDEFLSLVNGYMTGMDDGGGPATGGAEGDDGDDEWKG